MNEQYQIIIDTLTSQDFDAKALAVEVAKQYPEVFLKCLNPSSVLNKLEKEILFILSRKSNVFSSGGMIEAIKHYKGATNLGLKEAKDAVESMRERFLRIGVLQRA